MPYRRYPPAGYRRHISQDQEAGPVPGRDSIKLKDLDEIVSIPPPNKMDSTPVRGFTHHHSKTPSFLNFFKGRIKVDEIILLAIIFLLLDEGINDEFLLIILIYILFAGRE